MILHTVNKAAPALELCLRFATANDIILLMEDGVYCAVEGSADNETLSAADTGRIVAIVEDLVARGLEHKLSCAVEPIDYYAFVALCSQCDKVQSWF